MSNEVELKVDNDHLKMAHLDDLAISQDEEEKDDDHKKIKAKPKVIDLNVGGYFYSTTFETLKKEDNMLIEMLETNTSLLCKDSKDRIFIDRDGKLFRYVLDYLRNKTVVLPDNFTERASLRREAEYYNLENMLKLIDMSEMAQDATMMKFSVSSPRTSMVAQAKAKLIKPKLNTGYITVGYRGTFSNGRDGMNDVIQI